MVQWMVQYFLRPRLDAGMELDEEEPEVIAAGPSCSFWQQSPDGTLSL